MKNFLIAFAWLITMLGAFPSSASAQVLTEVNTGALRYLNNLTRGPDGDMWFSINQGIARITPQGVVREFNLKQLSGGEIESAWAMAFDKDGNLWFASNDCIARLSPQDVVSTFYAGSGVNGLAAGSDGNMWFSQSRVQRIGRITPEGVVTEFRAGRSFTDDRVSGITAGPDGNLWFVKRRVDIGNGSSRPARVGRITTQGTVTEFTEGISAEADVDSITVGADGNLWFTESFPQALGIGRITPQGVVTEFAIQSDRRTFRSTPIISGSDGNLWFGLTLRYRGQGESFAQYYIPAVARITPQGSITEFTPFGPSPPIDASATMTMEIGEIAADHLGNLWLTTHDHSVDSQRKLWRLDPGSLPSARLAVTMAFSPPDDPGRFDMTVDRAVKLSGAWMGSSTLPFGVSPGIHEIGAAPAAGTNKANYTVTVGGDCNAQGQVSLTAGDSKTCTVAVGRKPDNSQCLAICKNDFELCMSTAGSIAMRQLCINERRECSQGC